MKYHLQRSFSSGELSDLVHMRNDYGDIHKSGLSVLENMIASPKGPAVTRAGFKNILTIIGKSDARIETIPRISGTTVYIFLDFQLLTIKDIDNPVYEFQDAPWSEAQISEIQFVPLPSGKTIYVFHPEVQTHKIDDSSGAAASSDFIADGTFLVPNGVFVIDTCVAGGGGGGASGWNFSAGGGGGGAGVQTITGLLVTPGETLDITIGAPGPSGIPSAGQTDGVSGGISSIDRGAVAIASGLGAEGGKAGDSAVGPTSSGGLGSNSGGDGGKGGTVGGGNKDAEPGGDCLATCGTPGFIGGALPGPAVIEQHGGGGGAGGFGDGGRGSGDSSGGANFNDGDVSGGGGGGYYDVIGGGNPGYGGGGKISISWINPVSLTTLTPVTFTLPPLNWGGTNWPACGAYYQGRLWMGGARLDPEQFVGSQSGDPENLAVGTALAAEAIAESMEEYGTIKWIYGKNNLIIATGTGEYILASDQKILIPGNISIDQQSAYGSNSIRAIPIGDQIIFVSTDSRRLNSFNYLRDISNFSTLDLSFYSPHITNAGIKDISWSQHPDKILWVLTEDGNISSLSYERDNDTFGWSRHPTNGIVKSIGSVYSGKKNKLIIVVERNSGDIEIEVSSDIHKLDSWQKTNVVTQYSNNPDLFYVEEASFSKLDGKTVQILIDGTVHEDRVVGADSAGSVGDGASGRVYLIKGGAEVVIGLQYTAKLHTIKSISEFEEGNDFMHMKTYSEIALVIKNSKRPIINGVDSYKRGPSTSQGSAEPAKSETIIQKNRGWSQDAIIEIEQPLPYFLTVLAVGGKYRANKT